MDRVYMILDIMEGKHGEAVQNLQATPGVQWVDVLEGQWDVIVVIEASNRQRLARLLVQSLASVENITEDLQLLPAHDGYSVQSTGGSVGKVTINKAGGSKRAWRSRDNLDTVSQVCRRVPGKTGFLSAMAKGK